MRLIGGSANVAVVTALLIVIGGCGAASSESSANQEAATNMTETTADPIATTAPGLGSEPTSSGRAERPNLSELFLTADDLSGWDVGIPTETAPPPANLSSCSPLTDAEIAFNVFESWLTHEVQISGFGGSQFQMLGQVPDGVDAVSVVEELGTLACLESVAAGAIGIESGMSENPPSRVTAAAYLMVSYDGGSYVGVFAVLDNGLVMAFGAVEARQLDPSDIESNFALAAAKASAR